MPKNKFALDVTQIRGDARAKMGQGAVTKDAVEERRHMERAAERVSQLGGTPDLSPKGLSKSHDLNDLLGN